MPFIKREKLVIMSTVPLNLFFYKLLNFNFQVFESILENRGKGAKHQGLKLATHVGK